jgi:hypothetical protein
MAQGFPDISLSGEWQDITQMAGYMSIANQTVTLQAKYGYAALVYFGGASAPAGVSGFKLAPDESYTGTSDHVWVRGSGSIAIGLED